MSWTDVSPTSIPNDIDGTRDSPSELLPPVADPGPALGRLRSAAAVASTARAAAIWGSRPPITQRSLGPADVTPVGGHVLSNVHPLSTSFVAVLAGEGGGGSGGCCKELPVQ